MFDRTYVQRGPSHVSVSVEEKRAPTDESVRLLREMEAKAMQNVVESLRLTSADVEAVAHRYDSHMDVRSFIKIHYKVNGTPRQCTVETEHLASIHQQIDKVWKALADDLAAYLMGNVLKSIGKAGL